MQILKDVVRARLGLATWTQRGTKRNMFKRMMHVIAFCVATAQPLAPRPDPADDPEPEPLIALMDRPADEAGLSAFLVN